MAAGAAGVALTLWERAQRDAPGRWAALVARSSEQRHPRQALPSNPCGGDTLDPAAVGGEQSLPVRRCRTTSGRGSSASRPTSRSPRPGHHPKTHPIAHHRTDPLLVERGSDGSPVSGDCLGPRTHVGKHGPLVGLRCGTPGAVLNVVSAKRSIAASLRSSSRCASVFRTRLGLVDTDVTLPLLAMISHG